MFRLPHSLAVLLVKVASHVSERKAGYRFEDASCVKALRHATIPMMFIHGGADTFVNPKYLDINYNACASIDREKLLIPSADHTMSGVALTALLSGCLGCSRYRARLPSVRGAASEAD